MNRKLTLMRHAEAETGIGYQDDINRSLTAVGVGKLHRLNKALRESAVGFDLVIKSPATRAMETAGLITAGLFVGEELQQPDIYESSTEKLLEIISSLPDRFERVLLVGHNPSLSSLLTYLTDGFTTSLSPGMMAVISLDLPNWNMISKGSGSLSEVLQ